MDNEFLSDSDEGFEDENLDNLVLRGDLRKDIFVIGKIPWKLFDNVSFQKNYRFSKGTVIEILLPVANDRLKRLDNCGLPVSPLMQLLLTLRFFATRSFQVCMFYSNIVINK